MSNLASNAWRCVHLLRMIVKTGVLKIRRVQSNAPVKCSNACTIVPVKTDARRDASVVSHLFVGHSSVRSQIQIQIILNARIEIKIESI